MVVEVTGHFCIITVDAFFFKPFEQSRNLWSGKHPSSKGRRILCQLNSTAPPTPFTVLFSCSWAWSKGIAENVFVVLESTQWPCFSKSSLTVSGRDVISLRPNKNENKSFKSHDQVPVYMKVGLFCSMSFFHAVTESSSAGPSLSMHASCWSLSKAN